MLPSILQHPEQRDTVVNVGIYSVLVGGLPAVPQDEIDHEDIEAAVGIASKKKLDWQLEFATKYFDACVPNPPGFSSSVAAITILPSAADLANAWGKWYAAAGQLRRLRFIRDIIQEKVHYDINDDQDDDFDEDDKDSDEEGDLVTEMNISHAELRLSPTADDDDASQHTKSLRRKKKIDREIFRSCTENQDYYRNVLGVDQGSGFISYDFGPEQTAMYSREFAQGASNCCPNGCFEGRVYRATIDELREMERVALEKVHAANLLLDKAQVRALEDKQLRDARHSKKNSKREPPVLNKLSTPSLDVLEEEKDEEHIEPRKEGGFRENYRNSGSLRRRSQLGFDHGTDPEDPESQNWAKFESIMNEKPHTNLRSSSAAVKRKGWGFFKSKTSKVIEDLQDRSINVGYEMGNEMMSFGADVKDTVADHLIRESTYAVVTFMSRQAAVAARQCLADGRGQNRWQTSQKIPVPPLADAVPWNICFCRGCCRPVSLSIHQRQKVVRKYL